MKPATETFGIHLMIDGYGAHQPVLADKAYLSNLLLGLPGEFGMHRICEPVVVDVGPKNRKDPGGLSGFVMIAESHLSFHTFPARGFITMDLYTCQSELDCDFATSRLKSAFGLTDTDVFVQRRGLRYPTANIAAAA